MAAFLWVGALLLQFVARLRTRLPTVHSYFTNAYAPQQQDQHMRLRIVFGNAHPQRYVLFLQLLERLAVQTQCVRLL